MKRYIVVITIFLSSLVSANECIPKKDLNEIANHFSQFNKYLSNKDSYCEKDMDEQWFKIAKSLQLLKNLTPNEPQVDQQDGFTYKAISENNWWSYFTNRARKFSVKSRCQTGVVAYVRPFFGGGKIHLCPFFFDFNTSSQASTMMHEVRHFDGHSHTRCTQGNEKGNSGACDSKITNKGSYAISVQTLVGMARSSEISEAEKAMVEAEAVYMAFNKFNQVPELKINTSLLLSNGNGEVYNWDLEQKADYVLTMNNPAKVYASANYMTIYPEDRNFDAYRTSGDLVTRIEKAGLFAETYNDETLSERDKYQAITYLGNGGMLKDNNLILICDRMGGKLSNVNLDDKGQFNRIISIAKNSSGREHQNFLVSETGELLSYNCASISSTKVNFGQVNKSLSSDLADITQLLSSGDKTYALNESGELISVDTNGNKISRSIINLPIENRDWISIAPITKPEVF
jgi:uncharacterized protein YxeA